MSSPLKYLAASAILFISTAALTSEPTIPEFPREFLTNVGPSEWNGRTEPDDVSLVLKPARKHWGFAPEKESQNSKSDTVSEPRLERVTESQLKERAAAVDGRSYTVITPIYIGAAGNTSYVRFGNGNAGTSITTVVIVGNVTGRNYGTVTVTVPSGASPQYSITQILSAGKVTELVGGDVGYSLYVRNPDIYSYFQHVLYNSSNSFFENMSICSYLPNFDYSTTNQSAINIHTSRIIGYPAQVVLHNYLSQSVAFAIDVYESETGALKGTYTGTGVANGSYIIDFTTIQNAIGWFPTESEFHANIRVRSSTVTGFYALVGQQIFNSGLSAYINMSQVCYMRGDTAGVNIQTYERLPTIAYPASVTSATARLTQETVSVETPKSASEYSQLYVTKLGYQPSWYPYTAQDSAPIQIGLYKADTINKQPNFAKAIVPHDAGGWLKDYYNAGYFPTTFDRIKSIGGNTVVYADAAIIKTMDINAKSVELSGKYFPPDQMILDMGNFARSRGMDFAFNISIYPGDDLGGDVWTVPKFYSAIDKISDNDPFWDAWFNAYKLILAERAALAQRAGATRFTIGFSLAYMVKGGKESRWVELIKAARSAGFTGKISYIGSSSAFTGGIWNDFLHISDVNKRTAFIKLFDEIGLDINNRIFSTEKGETLSTAQPRTRIITNVKAQIASISSAKVPILLQIATPSVSDGLIADYYVEPILPCTVFKDKTRDYQVQADIYQSVAEIVNEQSSDGSGIVRGIFSWGYHYLDNPRKKGTAYDRDTCYDFGASIRNKPAESVLSYWFKGW